MSGHSQVDGTAVMSISFHSCEGEGAWKGTSRNDFIPFTVFFYHGLKCPLTRRKFQEKSFEDLIQVVSRIKTVYQGDNLASVQNPVERIEKEGRNPAANGLRDKV